MSHSPLGEMPHLVFERAALEKHGYILIHGCVRGQLGRYFHWIRIVHIQRA